FLKRCIFEAMRFKPIWLGPFRDCVENYTLACGTARAKRIRKGCKVLACTQSAMFDERRVEKPKAFDAGRALAQYLQFGFALHWCVGAFIAEAQITQTLKPLLRRAGLRRAARGAGRVKWLGPYPEHLWVEFER